MTVLGFKSPSTLFWVMQSKKTARRTSLLTSGELKTSALHVLLTLFFFFFSRFALCFLLFYRCLVLRFCFVFVLFFFLLFCVVLSCCLACALLFFNGYFCSFSCFCCCCCCCCFLLSDSPLHLSVWTR